MPPSSASIPVPNFSLNTIVAEELQKFADELEQAEDFNAAVHSWYAEPMWSIKESFLTAMAI